MAKKRSDQYHHGDLRREAIASAKKRLARSGHGDFSLPEISRDLGVSHAALYRHFKGKKGLLAELALEGYACSKAMILRSVRRSSGTASLEAAGRAYLRFARKERALFRAMFHPLLREKKSHPELERAAAESYAVLVELVDRLERPLEVSPKVFIAVFWSALHGAAVLEGEGWLPGRSGLKKSEMERLLPESIAQLLHRGASKT